MEKNTVREGPAQFAWQIKVASFFTNVASDLDFKEVEDFSELCFYSTECFKTQKEKLLQLFIHCPLKFLEKEDLKAYLAACFCAGTLKYLSSDTSKPNNVESLLPFIPAKD